MLYEVITEVNIYSLAFLSSQNSKFLRLHLSIVPTLKSYELYFCLFWVCEQIQVVALNLPLEQAY